MKIQDHSVSQETFELKYNPKYDWLETTPLPENLSSYYLSEDYISHTDANKSFFDKVYQFVKNINLNWKINLINHYTSSQEKTILDIGAGTGDFLYTAKVNNWKIQGVEPSKIAREKALKKDVILKKEISEITDYFDCVTMWHSLEHVDDLKKQLQFLKTHLKENGTLIIAVPNYKSEDAKIYKEYWAGYDVPRHLWHFSRKSITTLFKEYQFKVIQTKPMIFDAFYISLLSEKYKTGKMNIFKAFFNGLYSNLKALKTKEYSSVIYILKNCSTWNSENSNDVTN